MQELSRWCLLSRAGDHGEGAGGGGAEVDADGAAGAAGGVDLDPLAEHEGDGLRLAALEAGEAAAARSHALGSLRLRHQVRSRLEGRLRRFILRSDGRSFPGASLEHGG